MSVSNLVTTYTGQEYPKEADAQQVYSTTTIRTDTINSLLADSSINIKAVQVKDSIKYYYTGGAWVVSDGTYAQANTWAELTPAVMVAFTSIGSDFYTIILFGGDGTTQEYISNLLTDFSFAGDDPTIVKATIYGTYRNLCGEPQEGIQIKARVYKKQAEFSDGVILGLEYEETATNVKGDWEICVAYSITDTAPQYIEFLINGERNVKIMQYKETIKYTEMLNM